MDGEKKFLPVSRVSLLGSCETRFVEAMLGKPEVTAAMKTGAAAHKRLTIDLPEMTREEIMRQMSEKRRFEVREVSVYDDVLKLAGRIDHLKMTGTEVDGRNSGIITDDKYPKDTDRTYGLTLYYKLQLSTYAVAISNSRYYGNLCNIVGAELVYRDIRTDGIIERYGIDRKMLDRCTRNVKTAVDNAWMLYHKAREPMHRRFDVYSCEWTRCFCQQSGHHTGQERM